MIGTSLLSLISVLAAAYGVILGAVAVVTGWQLFHEGPVPRYRRGKRVHVGDTAGNDPNIRDLR